MKLKPYPEYKDSGVEWIGDIPEGWESFKIKLLGQFKNGNGFPESLQGNEHGDIPFLKVSDINDPKSIFVDSSNNFVSLKTAAENKWNIIEENSIIFPKIGEAINKNHRKINDKEIIIDNNLSAFLIKEQFYFKYIYYIFKELNMNDFLNISSVPSINMDLLKSHKFSVTVNIKEQKIITSFLDKKTSQIDKTIQKDTQLIELLKEKRTALINHAVTNGLDLDAKMKDSGVEWIGDIPEEWFMFKIKHLAGNCSNPVQTGPFGAQLHAEDYVNEGIPLILIRNVNCGRINDINIPYVSGEDAIRLSMYRLNVGDIVFSRVGSIGRAALVTDKEEGWLISGQMLRLRLTDKRIYNPYLVYLFQSNLSNEYVSLESVGSTRESLNTQILSNMSFPLPIKQKQEEIVNYLNKETSKIDETIHKIERKIELLEEYKKSLIHHVVTGKVDVREEVV